MARVVWWVDRRCIALDREEILKQQIAYVKQDLDDAPEGCLICNWKDGTYRYYHQTYSGKKRNRKYLNQNAFEVKLALARKKVNQALLIDYQTELEKYQRESECSLAEKVLESAAIRQIILEGNEKWSQEKYPRNTSFLQNCIHRTPTGIYVRSKSERDIAVGLYDWQLPNQYDRKFYFEKRTVSPDFTIRHPVTGLLILWEHFGRMNDPDYVRKTYEKLDLYMRHGFFPGENLIVTFEDALHPLTPERIEMEIQYHFKEWTQTNGKRK